MIHSDNTSPLQGRTNFPKPRITMGGFGSWWGHGSIKVIEEKSGIFGAYREAVSLSEKVKAKKGNSTEKERQTAINAAKYLLERDAEGCVIDPQAFVKAAKDLDKAWGKIKPHMAPLSEFSTSDEASLELNPDWKDAEMKFKAQLTEIKNAYLLIARLLHRANNQKLSPSSKEYVKLLQNKIDLKIGKKYDAEDDSFETALSILDLHARGFVIPPENLSEAAKCLFDTWKDVDPTKTKYPRAFNEKEVKEFREAYQNKKQQALNMALKLHARANPSLSYKDFPQPLQTANEALPPEYRYSPQKDAVNVGNYLFRRLQSGDEVTTSALLTAVENLLEQCGDDTKRAPFLLIFNLLGYIYPESPGSLNAERLRILNKNLKENPKYQQVKREEHLQSFQANLAKFNQITSPQSNKTRGALPPEAIQAKHVIDSALRLWASWKLTTEDIPPGKALIAQEIYNALSTINRKLQAVSLTLSDDQELVTLSREVAAAKPQTTSITLTAVEKLWLQWKDMRDSPSQRSAFKLIFDFVDNDPTFVVPENEIGKLQKLRKELESNPAYKRFQSEEWKRIFDGLKKGPEIIAILEAESVLSSNITSPDLVDHDQLGAAAENILKHQNYYRNHMKPQGERAITVLNNIIDKLQESKKALTAKQRRVATIISELEAELEKDKKAAESDLNVESQANKNAKNTQQRLNKMKAEALAIPSKIEKAEAALRKATSASSQTTQAKPSSLSSRTKRNRSMPRSPSARELSLSNAESLLRAQTYEEDESDKEDESELPQASELIEAAAEILYHWGDIDLQDNNIGKKQKNAFGLIKNLTDRAQALPEEDRDISQKEIDILRAELANKTIEIAINKAAKLIKSKSTKNDSDLGIILDDILDGLVMEGISDKLIAPAEKVCRSLIKKIKNQQQREFYTRTLQERAETARQMTAIDGKEFAFKEDQFQGNITYSRWGGYNFSIQDPGYGKKTRCLVFTRLGFSVEKAKEFDIAKAVKNEVRRHYFGQTGDINSNSEFIQDLTAIRVADYLLRYFKQPDKGVTVDPEALLNSAKDLFERWEEYNPKTHTGSDRDKAVKAQNEAFEIVEEIIRVLNTNTDWMVENPKVAQTNKNKLELAMRYADLCLKLNRIDKFEKAKMLLDGAIKLTSPNSKAEELRTLLAKKMPKPEMQPPSVAVSSSPAASTPNTSGISKTSDIVMTSEVNKIRQFNSFSHAKDLLNQHARGIKIKDSELALAAFDIFLAWKGSKGLKIDEGMSYDQAIFLANQLASLVKQQQPYLSESDFNEIRKAGQNIAVTIGKLCLHSTDTTIEALFYAIDNLKQLKKMEQPAETEEFTLLINKLMDNVVQKIKKKNYTNSEATREIANLLMRWNDFNTEQKKTLSNYIEFQLNKIYRDLFSTPEKRDQVPEEFKTMVFSVLDRWVLIQEHEINNVKKRLELLNQRFEEYQVHIKEIGQTAKKEDLLDEAINIWEQLKSVPNISKKKYIETSYKILHIIKFMEMDLNTYAQSERIQKVLDKISKLRNEIMKNFGSELRFIENFINGEKIKSTSYSSSMLELAIILFPPSKNLIKSLESLLNKFPMNKFPKKRQKILTDILNLLDQHKDDPSFAPNREGLALFILGQANVSEQNKIRALKIIKTELHVAEEQEVSEDLEYGFQTPSSDSTKEDQGKKLKEEADNIDLP